MAETKLENVKNVVDDSLETKVEVKEVVKANKKAKLRKFGKKAGEVGIAVLKNVGNLALTIAQGAAIMALGGYALGKMTNQFGQKAIDITPLKSEKLLESEVAEAVPELKE